MSKIVVAVNSMISNSDKISSVTELNNEYLFIYANRYAWGILERDGNYFLYFYPGIKNMEELRSMANMAVGDIGIVVYKTEDLKTRETLESFGELYLIVKEKLYGVDKALDDIIGNNSGF